MSPTHTISELVELVKDNASRRYEQGGDLIIECRTDAEIASAIGNCRTLRGAIWRVWREFGIQTVHEHRSEVRATAF